MEVQKYKKLKSGKYKVEFSNGKSLELYEDAILKYGLLIKKDITAQLILDITSYNEECDVYYQALKLIKVKPRSVKELEQSLVKKEYSLPLIKLATDKLVEQKYLNDAFFARSYTHSGIVASKGPNKIRGELEKKHVSRQDIEAAMEEYSKDIQTDIVVKKVKKMVNSNHTKSNMILKKKILMDLIMQGFDKAIITNAVEKQEFKDDQDIVEKEYQKIYKKLSRKYSGQELEYQIKQKMYQKGLVYEK